MALDQQTVTHICLLGDDPSANLTPLADTAIPSQKLIICFTEPHRSSMRSLRQVAKTRGVSVDCWLLPERATTEQLKLSFMQLIESESKHAKSRKVPNQIWLNASNGSRQQVLSAYEVVRSYQLPIYIVEPTLDKVCWLYPEGRESIEITDTIKLHEFFVLNGCTLVSQKSLSGDSSTVRNLGVSWLEKAKQLTKGLAKLNYLAIVARGPKLIAQMDKPMLDDNALQWLLDELHRQELIKVKGKNVYFSDQQTLFFCSGGWLEQVTYSLVLELTKQLPEIQDLGYSLEIKRSVGSQTVLNELDVVALVNNNLFVIECKTKQYNRGEGNQVLYKLDSLAERLGGFKAKAALVTFFPISSAERRRAKELSIEIFGPEQLPTLKTHLKRWMS
jgi:Card1-like endonuclease family protein